jgi:ABC-type uncharacterized transport system permease subunit
MTICLTPRREPLKSMMVWTPLMALGLTLCAGLLIFTGLGKSPFTAYYAFFIEPLSTNNGVSEWLLKASPLCLIALGLSMGYRANVWNIGAEGQMYIGGVFAAGVAIACQSVDAFWVLPLVVMASALGGALWGGITALCKAHFNANEILVSLMLTYVANLIIKYLVYGPWRDPMANNFPISISFSDSALFSTLAELGWSYWDGTRLNTSIFITLIVIPLIWLYLQRSFPGFQHTVLGEAPQAARYAGFSERRIIWTSLLLGGALAGLAGASDIAGPIGQLNDRWTPGYGFTAIIVASLGRFNAVGIVLASLLMALLYLGGEAVQVTLQLPKALSDVFMGLLLVFLLSCDVLVKYTLSPLQSDLPAAKS